MNRKHVTVCALLLPLFSLLSIMSCVKDTQEPDDVPQYDALIHFLEENRARLCDRNMLKTILALKLSDEQTAFYHARLTYFIDLLREDEPGKKRYYDIHFWYMGLFWPDGSMDVFRASKDMFDYWLMDLIEHEFDHIELPVNCVKEYYMEYRMMLNYDNLKDNTRWER